MIRNQRGASMIGVMLAIGGLIILLVLVVNSTTDNYLLKNVIKESEEDMKFTLNSLSQALIETSDMTYDTANIGVDTSVLINVEYFINALNLTDPQSYLLTTMYDRGNIMTAGQSIDILSTRMINDITLEIMPNQLSILSGNGGALRMKTVDYSFKSAIRQMYEKDINPLNPYIRDSSEFKLGANMSFGSLAYQDVNPDELRLRIPLVKEGGELIHGSYKAQ